MGCLPGCWPSGAWTGRRLRRRQQRAGRTDDAGDLDGIPGVCVQVKNYRDIVRGINEAMNDLPAQKRNSGAQHAAALVRRPGGRWIVTMSPEEWCYLLREAM